MSCDSFFQRVAELLDGSLTRSDREEVSRHLEDCADCRGLCAALAAAGDAPEDPGLAQAILARTTGAACPGARSRLCAWVDGELDAFDADLVEGHLRRCPECGDLARALERMQEELPRLAASDPGPRFVETVLSRTSRRPRRMPLRARGASVLSWLLDRPRVAWEGAFVATLVLAAPVLASRPPLADLMSRALDLVQHQAPERRRALGQLRGTVNDLEAILVVSARGTWARTGAAVVEDSTALASGLARQTTNSWETIRRRFGTFPGSAASGQKSGGTGPSDREPDAAQEKKQ